MLNTNVGKDGHISVLLMVKQKYLFELGSYLRGYGPYHIQVCQVEPDRKKELKVCVSLNC
jgi:hypothetical protein